MPVDFEAVEVTHEDYPGYMVEWEHIGEGYSGDYNPEDPTDAPLLRYTLFRAMHNVSLAEDPVWEQVDDASYCTQNTTSTTTEDLQTMGTWILTDLVPLIIAGEGYKTQAEYLSWVTPAGRQ